MSILLDSRSIDRLVDDELSPFERRQLLALADATPDGWRKVALAFLENQAWGAVARTPDSTEFAPVVLAPASAGCNGKADPICANHQADSNSIGEVVAATPRIAETTIRAGTSSRRSHAWLIAASLIPIFFATGLWLGRAGKADRSRSPFVPIRFGPSVERSPWSVSPPIETVGRLELTSDQSGEFCAGEVPIVSGVTLDSDWLGRTGSAVPDSLKARWEREGYQVEEQRSLMSVGLKDGRQAVVPIENVRVKYVGQMIY